MTIPLPLCLIILLLLTTPWAWAGGRHNPTAADDFPSDVASIWFDLLYDVVKTENSSPPAASRIYGLAAVALYEAIVPGSREHRSLVGQLNDLSSVAVHAADAYCSREPRAYGALVMEGAR